MSFDDARDVLVHGGARGIRIAPLQGAHDRGVFFDGRLQSARAPLVVHQVALRRTRARIPQHLHRGDDAAVLRRARDQLVEAAIRFLAHQNFVVLVVVAHFRDEIRQLLELRVVDAQRGERAGFTFDGAPRLEQLERTDVLGAFRAARAAAGS